MTTEIKWPNIDDFIYDEGDVSYVEINNEKHHIRVKLSSSGNLLQWGPPGTGKTLSFAAVGAETGVPVIQFDCSRDAKKTNLQVKPWMEVRNGTKQTVYIPGAMALGIRAANEYGSAIVVLEEINALLPAVQKMLNQMGDWRQHLNVLEAGRKLTLETDSNFLLGATMNPRSHTGGVFELNDDLKQRFSELRRSYPSNEKLKEILMANGVSDSIGTENDIHKQICSFARRIQSLKNNGAIDRFLSPRDLVRLGQTWEEHYDEFSAQRDDNPVKSGLKAALRTEVLDKYHDPTERDSLEDEIGASFRVTV